VVGHKKHKKDHKRHNKKSPLFCAFCAFLSLKPEFDEAVEDDLEGDLEKSDE
jgi:hypothetical protein